jgi:nickel-type superoxide dismutase maturation protease
MRTGDYWVVWRTKSLRMGQVVLLRHPQRPELLIVKRLIFSPEPGWWWIQGDNPHSSDDSRLFGSVAAGAIVGRVTFRYYPLRRRM